MAKKAQSKAEPAGKKRVDVHYLTRVEGHGNIVVEIEADGRVSACRWEVPEAPRFFEAMLIGRDYRDVHHIVSRICGICSIGHQLAATHKDAVLKLVAARRMSNEFCRLVCGRTTHPQRMAPGGWMKIPTPEDLASLRKMLVDSVPNLNFAVDLVASLAGKIPAFERKTEYVALVSPTDYALYWGEIGSSLDERHPVRDYKSVTREYCVPQSTAKWTKNMAESYMVGALARFNLNAEKLTPGAAAAAKKLGLDKGCTNPFMNTVAQLVECVHSVEDSLAIIDQLLARGLREEELPPVRLKAGKGAGAVEVPRGVLFHAYEYDDKGRIFAADCVIPTNQNHANIQKDMEALVPTLAKKSEAEIELILSMLVRAYDPCISCSTHTLDLRPGQEKKLVRFVRK